MARSLVSISDLRDDEISHLVELSRIFFEVNSREIPKVPTLRGKTIATLFFENSTRTRLSFELAATRLAADVLTFTLSSSSVSKGESLRDTAETIESLGADLIVMRHFSAGSVQLVSSWLDIPLVNAGDGAHEHPTQALLDAVTIMDHFKTGKRLDGISVAIVGDVLHSRVARSNVQLLSRLGANVTLVGPPSLLPLDLSLWPVRISNCLEDVLPGCDVIYMLRIQSERFSESLMPSIGEFSRAFALNSERLEMASKGAIVMHPGPMIKGVEITAEAAESPRSLIRTQVRNGVGVRMAVLYWLLGANQGRLESIW
ncbi:MAG: aspartate carbamoyltransferase catalytic subunit [Actinomycetota bacterium]|jgi:aspartate carbamoyltransferase catalytic subunit|nr:aspartate carbamoyltransferase catalytic subunit [Actinomycetota bacterium]